VLGRKTPIIAGVLPVKFAVTETLAARVTVQLPTPLQPPPLQPKKLAPASGVGVSVTVVPFLDAIEQVEPQSIPDGELCTFPLPCFDTTRLTLCAANVAVTDLLALMDTAHVPVPVHAPLQPVKVDPVTGVAVNVIEVPPE
jgi:hypothetical protein